MYNENKTYEELYDEFWKSIVENEDGTLNKDQIMRELHDFSMVAENCALAYCTMTDNAISKQNTKFFEVENIFNEKFTRTDSIIEDIIDLIDDSIKLDYTRDELITDLKDYFNIIEDKEVN